MHSKVDKLSVNFRCDPLDASVYAKGDMLSVQAQGLKPRSVAIPYEQLCVLRCDPLGFRCDPLDVSVHEMQR